MAGKKRQITRLDDVVSPSEYWGLKAIAKRMNCSVPRLKNLARAYHYPLLRLPARTARSWSYYTNEMLVLAWYSGLIQNTRRYLLQRKPIGTDQLREKQGPDGLPWQVPDTIDISSIHQVTRTQAPDLPATSASTNPNDINHLASSSTEGGGV